MDFYRFTAATSAAFLSLPGHTSDGGEKRRVLVKLSEATEVASNRSKTQ